MARIIYNFSCYNIGLLNMRTKNLPIFFLFFLSQHSKIELMIRIWYWAGKSIDSFREFVSQTIFWSQNESYWRLEKETKRKDKKKDGTCSLRANSVKHVKSKPLWCWYGIILDCCQKNDTSSVMWYCQASQQLTEHLE